MFIEIKVAEKAGDESSLLLHFNTIGEKIDWYAVLTGEMIPGEEELSDEEVKDKSKDENRAAFAQNGINAPKSI